MSHWPDSKSDADFRSTDWRRMNSVAEQPPKSPNTCERKRSQLVESKSNDRRPRWARFRLFMQSIHSAESRRREVFYGDEESSSNKFLFLLDCLPICHKMTRESFSPLIVMDGKQLDCHSFWRFSYQRMFRMTQVVNPRNRAKLNPMIWKWVNRCHVKTFVFRLLLLLFVSIWRTSSAWRSSNLLKIISDGVRSRL